MLERGVQVTGDVEAGFGYTEEGFGHTGCECLGLLQFFDKCKAR